MLKHPATLNIATPKGQGWLKHYDPKLKPNENEITRSKAYRINNRDKYIQAQQSAKEGINSMERIVDSFNYFINFMTENSEGASGTIPCKLGWLASMEMFSSILQGRKQKDQIRIGTSIVQFPLPKRHYFPYVPPPPPPHLYIVHYEDFNKPIEACLDIYNFATGFTREETHSLQIGSHGAAAHKTDVNGTMTNYLLNLELCRKYLLPRRKNSRGHGMRCILLAYLQHV